MTLFRRLSLATTLTTIGVIGVGALVRATGSGDGCPDWPRCFGRLIPPLEKHAIIEYSHRSIGAIAITMLCITALVGLVTQRANKRAMWPVLVATPGIFMQAALGATVVIMKGRPNYANIEPWFVTFHIATAMILLALLAHGTIIATIMDKGIEPQRTKPTVIRWARIAAVAVFAQILVGAFVRGQHAGLVFLDFPLMNGTLLPTLGGRATAMFVHRMVGTIVLAILITFAVKARGSHKGVARFAMASAVLGAGQIFVGGLQVWTLLSAGPVVGHVLLAALIWTSVIAALSLARGLEHDLPAVTADTTADLPSEQVTPPLATTIKAYIALTKPRIVLLLLITTVPTMILAQRGLPSVWLMFITVFGGALAAGSANAINMVIDRDIDAIMARTKRRPLPAHNVTPTRAMIFATALAVISFVIMTNQINLLSALLTQSAIAFYVLVYTLGLKRSTPQNIVIGGAAGAVPVLVGWSAVTGTVGWEAVLLFTVVFLWTPPHFWALAMRYSADYARAGVPMMPVVAGREETTRQIVLYSIATVAVTIILAPIAGLGAIYLAAACGLGAWLLRSAMILLRDRSPAAAMNMFKFSISYLGLIFIAVGVDTLLPLTS